MKKTNKKGFTLVELIVVIVVLGILMAIAIPNVIAYIDKANVKADGLSVRNVYLAACSVTAEAYGQKTAGTDFALTAANITDIEKLAGVKTSSIAVETDSTKTAAADKYTVFIEGNKVSSVVMGSSISASGNTVTYSPTGAITTTAPDAGK